MNPLRILSVVSILAVGARAETAPTLPDRPAIALSKYNDAWVPLIGFSGGAPVALDNGGKVPLPANSGIIVSVGDRYADGFVTIANATLTNAPMATDPDVAESMDSDMKSNAENYEADFTSDIDIPNAYALFILPTPSQIADMPPKLAVLVRPIGDLQAGKPLHVTARLPKLAAAGAQDWVPLVYTEGRQVRSTGMGQVLPAYFDGIETNGLRKHIAERVAKGSDGKIAVFRQMPLGLPAAIEAKYHETTVKVKVAVNAEGQVVSATPEGLNDPQLSQALAKGFSTWLFVPPVKGGAAEPGTAIIPLKM